VIYLLGHNGRYFMTADTTTEAEQFAGSLHVDPSRIRGAGTPRWYYPLTGDEFDLALWMLPGNADDIRQVDLPFFRSLVAARAAGRPHQPPRRPKGTPRLPSYNPNTKRHRWARDREHWQHCLWCGLVEETVEVTRWKYFHRWRWPTTPDGKWDASEADGEKMPRCPGHGGELP
jgi:hypothetical protein